MWFEFWIESVPLIPAIKLGAAFVLSRASSQIAQIIAAVCGRLCSRIVRVGNHEASLVWKRAHALLRRLIKLIFNGARTDKVLSD